MANLNHLCRTLLHAMDTGKRDLEDHVVLQIRAALSEAEPEVCYEFVVSNDEGCTEAGGTAPTLSQAIDEGRHYLAQYSQDGHYTLEVRCVETVLIRRSI
jgi:hypothetical protein